MISKNVIKSSSLLRSKRKNMRSATGRETKRVLVEKAVVVEGAAVARPCSKRKNLLEAVRRKKEMVRVMKGIKKKPASKNSRK